MPSPSRVSSCTASLAVAFCICTNAAYAHDEKPQYGGIVQSEKDIAYELVSHDEGLKIYVSDHGNPVSMAGVQGMLVATTAAGKSTERQLTQFSTNVLLAAGLQLEIGQKATVVLRMPSGRSVVVRFPAK